MKKIDMNTWDRKEHYNYFRTMDYPHFDVCGPIDVSQLVSYVKANRLPFYYAMIFAASTAANQIKNFRYRIRGGDVFEHEAVHPSFTHMDAGSELFKYVTADLRGDMAEFAQYAQNKAQSQKGLYGSGTDEARDDLLFITCVPWVSFTQLSHAFTLNKDDSIPRISWGKYDTDGGKILMSLSVQVHHALADGLHIGRYFEALQAFINGLKTD